MSASEHIVIRCDGGPQLGMGHITRCLALAVALRAEGVQATFATWANDECVARKIRDGGFSWAAGGPAPTGHNILSDQDLEATAGIARLLGAGRVLVDHYRADSAYFAGLARAGLGVAVIDDLADRDLTTADWVLNQNPTAGSVTYRVSADCVVLRGLEYALLRPQFAATRAGLRRSFGASDSRVLVTLGGGAMAERCAAVIEALNVVPRKLTIRCVVGTAEGAGAIARAMAQSKHNVSLLTDVSDMAGEMALSDVSVNAGGSTCWELMCLGVPMVSVSLSDDQAGNVGMLGDRGVGVGVGAWSDAGSPGALAQAVSDLLDDPKRRAAMSVRAMDLVDGLGATRAAQSLVEASMTCGGAV